MDKLKVTDKLTKQETIDKLVDAILIRQHQLNTLIEGILGKGWYVAESMNENQTNEIAVQEILDKFRKKGRL